ncbi:MAG: hypothetical protein J5679_01315, partial [Alphaproteobacteria bacterium]|nr:hypothetical protein [Alphaproteobacteria bacterium]
MAETKNDNPELRQIMKDVINAVSSAAQTIDDYPQLRQVIKDIVSASSEEERQTLSDNITKNRQDVITAIISKERMEAKKLSAISSIEQIAAMSDEEYNNFMVKRVYMPLLKEELQRRQKKNAISVWCTNPLSELGVSQQQALDQIMTQKYQVATGKESYKYANLNNFPNDIASNFGDTIDDRLFIITNEQTGVVDAPSGNNFDLRKAVIIGDYNCRTYKPATDHDDISRAIPLAVTGVFDCSNWDADLFLKIEKFPHTKTIDCSNTIEFYEDFAAQIDKLPEELETLVVQSSFFSPNDIRDIVKEGDENTMGNNLGDVMAFFKRYPNVKVITTKTNRKGKGTSDLKTLIEKELEDFQSRKDKVEQEKPQPKPKKPVPAVVDTDKSTPQEPEFKSLQDILSALHKDNPALDLSLLTDDEIQTIITNNLKDKFIKKDANGRVVGIRKDRITPFENQIIRAVTDKTNDGGDQQITQNPDNTKGDNSATATDASAPKQRTVWLTKSVIDKLQEYHGLPLKKRIKSLNELQNPETKYEIQNVDGITDGKAIELTPQAYFRGGIRLYVASFDPKHIIVLRFGSKNSQDSDLNFVKESASLFTTINNELKDELKKYKQTPSQITLYGETLYNYDSDLVRSQLKLPTKNSANTQNEDEIETQDTETNTNETSIILPDKNTVDSIDATPSSDKFITPSYSGQSDEKTDTKTQSQPSTEQPGTPQKRKYVKRQDVKYTLRQLVDLMYAASPISLSGPDFKKSVEFALVQFGESGEYVIPVMVKSSLLYTVPDMPRLTALVIHQAQHWRTPDDAAKLYYETHPKPNNVIAVAELSTAIKRRCQEIINDKNLEDVSIAYFRIYNDTFFLKTDELDDFVTNIVQWTPITELTTPKTSLVESTGSDTSQQEEEEEAEEEEKKETKEILDVQP